MEGTSLDALTTTLRSSGSELEAAEGSLPGAVTRGLDGAGEFADALQEGLLTFQLSWCAALRTFATSADAVGSLAQQTDAVMAQTDAAMAQSGADLAGPALRGPR